MGDTVDLAKSVIKKHSRRKINMHRHAVSMWYHVVLRFFFDRSRRSLDVPLDCNWNPGAFASDLKAFAKSNLTICWFPGAMVGEEKW